MVDVTVMARIDLRGADLSTARLRAALPRGGVDVEAALSTVRPIIDADVDRVVPWEDTPSVWPTMACGGECGNPV
jgi:hypothetical protein